MLSRSSISSPESAAFRMNWMLVGLFAVLASCSSSKGNPCDTKVCPAAPDGGESADVCNPADGLCYCGTTAVAGSDGGGGVVCQMGTTCDPVSDTCVSVLCAGIVCGATGACDPIDGTCKCGGAVCPSGDICDQLSSTCEQPIGICQVKPPCPVTLMCDAAKNGDCVCYIGGPACGSTQVCDMDGGCIDDPCFGVSCTAPGAACFGGECKCGGANGVLCSAPGESCSPIDNSCGPTASCAITPCPTNTVCNAQDTLCHCGSTSGTTCNKNEACVLYIVDGGPLAPFEDAGGALVYGRCLGNDPCKGVTCPPFETCDENNNGACECGGAPDMNIPGIVCASDESCVATSDGGAPECLLNCQPFAAGQPCPALTVPDASTLVDEGCYYFQASKATVCAPSTAPDAGVGATCVQGSDCSATGANNNLTCASYLTDGGAVLVGPACISFCDVFPAGGPTSTPAPDGGTHPCPVGEFCSPLPAGIIAGICEQ